MPVRLIAAFAALAAPAILLASVATAQEPPPAPAQAQPAPAQQPAPPPDPKAVLESVCTACHGLDFITSQGRTRDRWDVIVHRMIDKGADLDPDTAALVIDYLAKTYPSADAPPAATAPKPPGA